MIIRAWHMRFPQQQSLRWLQATALQKLDDPDQIAKTALYLAAGAASFIIGTEPVADGRYLNCRLK